MSADTDKLVGVRKDALARTKHDYRMIFRDIIKKFKAVLLAPIFVWHGFERTFKIAINIILVKRIVYFGIFIKLLFVEIMSQGKVEARFTHVRFVVRYRNDRSVINGCFNFGIAIDAHDLFFPIYWIAKIAWLMIFGRVSRNSSNSSIVNHLNVFDSPSFGST
ncbi:hypothetical protein D3C72_1465560 [compost metagenome]